MGSSPPFAIRHSPFALSNFLAEQPVDRIAAAAAEEDRQAEQPPQQGVFITLGGPEVAELPLEKDDDDSHLDPDDQCRHAGEKPDREANRGYGFGEDREIGPHQRIRHAHLLIDVRSEIHHAAEHDLLDAVRYQHRTGGEAHERITRRRKGLVEFREARKYQPRFVERARGHVSPSYACHFVCTANFYKALSNSPGP